MDFGCTEFHQQIHFCLPTLVCTVADKSYSTYKAFSKRNISCGVVATQHMKAFVFYSQTRHGKILTVVK